MSYSNTWNETAPLDTSLASLLGQDIRTFKTDIRERVAQMSGTLANRPTPESVWDRLLYFSIDTGQIFQWTGATGGTNWVDVTSFFIKIPASAGGGMVDVQQNVTIAGAGGVGPQTLITSNVPVIGKGQGLRVIFAISSSGPAAPIGLDISYNGNPINLTDTLVVNIGGAAITSGFTYVNVPNSQTSQCFFMDPVIPSTGSIFGGYATPQTFSTAAAGTITVSTEAVLAVGSNITFEAWILELI